MKTLSIAALIFFVFTPIAWSKDIDLFFIERNKNKNEVHYQLHVDDNCRIVSEEPITAYWKMLEENDSKTKSLSVFDKMAYSVTNQVIEGDWVFFNLKALETRLIKATVKKNPETSTCEPTVQAKINSKWALLDHIYVFSTEGFLMPKVVYVDIIGQSLDANAIRVTERIEP